VPPRAAWLTSKREAGSSVTLYRNPVALLVDAELRSFQDEGEWLFVDKPITGWFIEDDGQLR
jgi:hypothetical protein